MIDVDVSNRITSHNILALITRINPFTISKMRCINSSETKTHRISRVTITEIVLQMIGSGNAHRVSYNNSHFIYVRVITLTAYAYQWQAQYAVR